MACSSNVGLWEGVRVEEDEEDEDEDDVEVDGADEGNLWDGKSPVMNSSSV